MNKDRKYLYYRAYLIYFGFVFVMLGVLYSTLDLQLNGPGSAMETQEGDLPTRVADRIREWVRYSIAMRFRWLRALLSTTSTWIRLW